jgi:hypothetical protein
MNLLVHPLLLPFREEQRQVQAMLHEAQVLACPALVRDRGPAEGVGGEEEEAVQRAAWVLLPGRPGPNCPSIQERRAVRRQQDKALCK